MFACPMVNSYYLLIWIVLVHHIGTSNSNSNDNDNDNDNDHDRRSSSLQFERDPIHIGFPLCQTHKSKSVSQPRYVRFMVVILSSYHISFPYSSPPSLLGFVSNMNLSPLPPPPSTQSYFHHTPTKVFFCPSSLGFLGSLPLYHILQTWSYCNNNIILAIMVPLFCFSTALFYYIFYNSYRCYCMKFGWNFFFLSYKFKWEICGGWTERWETSG